MEGWGLQAEPMPQRFCPPHPLQQQMWPGVVGAGVGLPALGRIAAGVGSKRGSASLSAGRLWVIIEMMRCRRPERVWCPQSSSKQLW